MEYAVREMNLEDYPAVFALWGRTPGVGLRSLDDSQAGIGQFLARNPRTCFVAEEGGAIGAILAGHDGRRGYIYHLCVDPSARRRGVGRALVARAEAALQKEGIRKAALVCFASNAEGNAFWASLGYIRRDDLTYRNRSLDENNI